MTTFHGTSWKQLLSTIVGIYKCYKLYHDNQHKVNFTIVKSFTTQVFSYLIGFCNHRFTNYSTSQLVTQNNPVCQVNITKKYKKHE